MAQVRFFVPILAAVTFWATSEIQAQPLSRVSLSSGGEQGAAESGSLFGSSTGLTTDGRWVLFASLADNLVSGDTNGRSDVFVHDSLMGITERISVGPGGREADDDSLAVDLSVDGRFILFSSEATNLVEGDTNGTTDLFVRDRATGTTERVSVSSAGVEANDGVHRGGMSADGNRIVFTSSATNLIVGDDNVAADVFVRDRSTGTTRLVSVDSNGNPGNADSGSSPSGLVWGSSISDDGRFVAFSSLASDLVPADTGGASDIYVHDLETGETTLQSLAWDGSPRSGFCYAPVLSADGRFVAFWTDSRLVPSDTFVGEDIYVRDRSLGTLTRVSVDSGGQEADRHSSWPSISADGRYVAFVSRATNLVPGDDNGLQDAFVHDRITGETTRVGQDSLRVRLSRVGRHAVFDSDSDDLLSGDTNGVRDVFLHDRLSLTFEGPPKAPAKVRYRISNALGEAGNRALVLISCSGTSGIPLPDGRTIPLTFDACTILGILLAPALEGTIDEQGEAWTAPTAFPSAQAGITVYSAAVSLNATTRDIVSITGPISYVTR